MKKVLKKLTKERVKTIIIIILVLIIGYLFLEIDFQKDEKNRCYKTIAEKYNGYPKTFIMTPESTTTVENPKSSERPTENQTSQEKNKYEKILEKYTLGDSQYGTWLPTLFNDKLTDLNKLYMVLNSKNNLVETTSAKCEELVSNTPHENLEGGTVFKIDDKSAFCYSSNRYYNYERLNAEYHSMFGKSTDLIKVQGLFYYEHSYAYAPYVYSEKINGYVKFSCNCGGTGNHNKFYRIVDTQENENSLTIDIKYLEFNNLTDSKTEEELDKEFENENLKKYRFNFERDYDNYYLISIDNLN